MANPAKIYYARADMTKFKKLVNDFSKDYYEAMIRLFQDAAAEFAWRTVQEVSVDTGMSAASLEPLAEAVGTTILPEFSGFIKHPFRPWGTAMTGLSQRGRIRSVDAGIRAGRSAYKFSYGSLRNPYFVFTFKINVCQCSSQKAYCQTLILYSHSKLMFGNMLFGKNIGKV